MLDPKAVDEGVDEGDDEDDDEDEVVEVLGGGLAVLVIDIDHGHSKEEQSDNNLEKIDLVGPLISGYLQNYARNHKSHHLTVELMLFIDLKKRVLQG